MRVKQAILFVVGLTTTVTYGGICWTNGASLLLGRPLSNPFGLPQQTNCNIPIAPAPAPAPRPVPAPVPVPAPAPVCPPPVTSWSTTTTTQISMSTTTATSTTTETSISATTTTDWSTTTSTETSTSTVTSCTATITSWGIDPAVAAMATAKCVQANPAQTIPVFNAAGKPRCCLPISTMGANALPTKIC